MKKIIEAIIQWLAHWDKDKLLHVMIVMIVALTTASILHVAGFVTWIIIVGSLLAAAIAAIGKEIYDEYKDGDWFDTKDLIADGVGLVLAELYIITLIL